MSRVKNWNFFKKNWYFL